MQKIIASFFLSFFQKYFLCILVILSCCSTLYAQNQTTTTIISDQIIVANPQEQESTQSTHKNISVGNIKYLPIPLPQYEERPLKGQNKLISFNIQTRKETIQDLPAQSKESFGVTPGVKYRPDLKDIPELLKNNRTFNDLYLVYNPQHAPYRTTVKLKMKFGSSYYMGSGILISPYFVLTAGHCVYDYGRGSWADEITVIPGYNYIEHPYGEATVSNLYSWGGWTDSGSFDYDMGVIQLDRPIGAIVDTFGYSYNNDDSFFTNTYFYTPGYPGVYPYDGEFLHAFSGYFDKIFPYQLRFNKKSYGGQSGSGVYDGSRCVYAVLSNGTDSYTNDCRIDSTKYNSILGWINNHTPSSIDFIPLNTTVPFRYVASGQSLPSLKYIIYNNSSASYSSPIQVKVYLSTNKIISSADTLLQTHSITNNFSNKSSVIVNVTPPPTLPSGIYGTYYIGIMLDVADNNTANNYSDEQDVAEIFITSSLHTINTPTMPSGPSTGEINQNLTYSTNSFTCNQGHTVEYQFDWHDGTSPTWTTSNSASHTYKTSGSFGVDVQARCSHTTTLLSQWSNIKTITIPEKKDNWDHEDDDVSQATLLVPSTSEQQHGPHSLSTLDVYDWYKIYMYENTRYVLKSTSSREKIEKDRAGDTYAELFSNSDGTNLVAYNDEGNGNSQFLIDYKATSTKYYYLRVRTYTLGKDWDGYIHYYYYNCIPPSITTHPISQIKNYAASVTFSVVADGSSPLSYQWQKNNINIYGATSSSYTDNFISETDEGAYRCIVSNSYGTAVSNEATLKIIPTIITHPENKVIELGHSTILTIYAAGPSLKYQWKKNNAILSGATSSSYIITQSQIQHAGDYTCTISNAAGTVTSNIATISIISTNVSDISISESNSKASIPITLSHASNQTINLSYKTQDSTAKAGLDYIAQSGVVSFAPGETTKQIPIHILNDQIAELSEIFTISITADNNVYLTKNLISCTIIDDDSTVEIAISDATIKEGNSGDSIADFVVSLSKPSSQTIKVNYKTVHETTSADDYTAKLGTLTFAPNETTKKISILVHGNTVFEPDEKFYVNLFSPIGATIIDEQGVGTILNDDSSISINNVTIQENNKYAIFTINLSTESSESIQVSYTAKDGTAKAGIDYVKQNGILIFEPSNKTKEITIPIYDDTQLENSEVFYIDLSLPINAVIANTRGTCTIQDNDTTPIISINDVSISEGNKGVSKYATFVVGLSNPSITTITTKYATANGTAISGSDYTAKTGTVTFSPGVTQVPITIEIKGDGIPESDETFFINLFSAVNGELQDTQAQCTILQSQAILPTIAINNCNVDEGNSFLSETTFIVTLSEPSQQTISVKYLTANGTALVNQDYYTKTGILIFEPGVTTQEIKIAIIGDSILETNEIFYVNLSTPSNATILTARGICTINNDDTIPGISISNATLTEGTSTTTNRVFKFLVTLSAPTSQIVKVQYNTENDTAIAGKDYIAKSGTLSFAANVVSLPISITVYSDSISEETKQFKVLLYNQQNATIVDNEGIGTINNDDINITIDDVIASESNSIKNVDIPVHLSRASTRTVTVLYATAANTALAEKDYKTTSGCLTFAPGETTKNITVCIYGEQINEADEKFLINLSKPINATITDAQGICLITNDDQIPSITVQDITVFQRNFGVSNASFTVSLSAPAKEIITVKYATANGTALAGIDYIAKSGTLSFPVGTIQSKITISVYGEYRKKLNQTFFINLSSPVNAILEDNQGQATIVPAIWDFDGDACSDLVVWNYIHGKYCILESKNSYKTYQEKTYQDFSKISQKEQLAFSNDISWQDMSNLLPICGDYNGDGITELALWNSVTEEWISLNPSNLESSENISPILYQRYIFPKTTNQSTNLSQKNEWIPVPADYDGDRKTDIAVWNSMTGEWYCLKSSDNNQSYLYKTWGKEGIEQWLPVPADYDGDAKADISVWNKITGEWYCLKSSDNNQSYLYKTWGKEGIEQWLPVPADYDGDAKADISVWNKITGEWYCLKSSMLNNEIITKESFNLATEQQICLYKIWGCNTMLPVPADYNGDGKVDIAVWDQITGEWYCLQSNSDNQNNILLYKIINKNWVPLMPTYLYFATGILSQQPMLNYEENSEIPIDITNTEIPQSLPGILNNSDFKILPEFYIQENTIKLPGYLEKEIPPINFEKK